MDLAKEQLQDSSDPWRSARQQLKNGLLSVIMPAHDLESSIESNLKHVHELFNHKLPFEIVVVDDGSADGTAKAIAEASKSIPELRPVYLRRNFGKGEALRQGFEHSRGSFVLLLDGDLDLPPEQVSRFFQIMLGDGADVVIGSKLHPESDIGPYPWHRRITSMVYYGMVKLLIGLPVRDTQTGIKLFKREALAWAFPRMLVKKFAFDLELLAIVHEKGYKVSESPVTLKSQARWSAVRPSLAKQVAIDTLAIFYRLKLLRYYQSIPTIKDPSAFPLVSVVIALPKPSPYLDECLKGLKEQTYTNFEIILLPDAASGLPLPKNTREIPTGAVRPAEKRNVGLREARGEIVAFIDDDAFPVDSWLQQAVPYFSDETIGAVGGPGTTPPNDSKMANLGGAVLSNRLVSGNYKYRYQPGRVLQVEDFPSCNLLVKTTILREIGGFRTDFWPGEDTYLCMEIVKRLGKVIMYDPRVQVYHHRRELFLPHLRQIGRYALHRGFFARRFPSTSRRLSYFVPSIFVLGLSVGGCAAIFFPMLRTPYALAVLSYAAITFVAAAERNILNWLGIWLGIILTHLVYGIRFMVGYFVPSLPEKVHKFDHVSETVV